MLIETASVSKSKESEDATLRKGVRGVWFCVCVFKRTQLAWGRGICLEKRRENDLHCDTDPREASPAPWGTPGHQAKDNQRARSE